MYELVFKRLLDILLSLSFMILFCWLYLILALIVYFKMGSPIIFSQERPGKDEKIFRLYKFRSMADKRDENGELLPDKERLGRFGRLLRSTSLDELPELFNILKGDMSFVGPRPLLVKYLEHYNSFERRRHEVRPGLTGLAQASGRNALSWKEKFEKDVEYVDNVTFMMDLMIILMTLKKVIKREGIEFGKGHQPIREYFETHDKD
ncbi:MAG: sugar transferase [Erysipelotrichaceae bacterium]|nr:sugar transferase [Erysipelotrichaceae bacterium]